MPVSPKNSTASSRPSETTKASAAMLRQNQIGTIATNSISAMPRPKRFICGSAQRPMSPPATEVSIKKPIPAAAASRSSSAQLR